VQEAWLDLCVFNETSNVQVILGQFYPELTEEERLYGWFQQDSATAHTARMSTHALSDVFRDRNISSDIWPTRSPDFNPCVSRPGFSELQSEDRRICGA
jgi:hypothetical protein